MFEIFRAPGCKKKRNQIIFDDLTANVLLLVPFLEEAGSALGSNVENGPKSVSRDLGSYSPRCHSLYEKKGSRGQIDGGWLHQSLYDLQ